METFQKLERLINLYDGYQACFEVAGTPLLLVHENNRSHILLNRCPHQGSPLGNACLHSGSIRCPRHGLEFSLETGNCLKSGNYQLTKYKPAFEDQFIGVYLTAT